MFVVKILYKNYEYYFRVYVFKNFNSGFNLLSWSVVYSMGFVMKVEEIWDVFGIYGCVKGLLVNIILKFEVVFYCVIIVWRILFLLMLKVELEFKCMEDVGIIIKVIEFIDWCVLIVIVFKKNGDVCLCVDLKKFN